MFSTEVLYYNCRMDFIHLEGHLFFFFLEYFYSLLFYGLTVKLFKLDGLVNICNYHKCFYLFYALVELRLLRVSILLCSTWPILN